MKCQKPSHQGAAFLFFPLLPKRWSLLASPATGRAGGVLGRRDGSSGPRIQTLRSWLSKETWLFLSIFSAGRPFANILSHRPESRGFLRARETHVPVTPAFCPCKGKLVSRDASPQALTLDILEGGRQL